MLLFIFYCLQLPLLFYISSQSDLLSNQCSALLEFRKSFITNIIYAADDPNLALNSDYILHSKPIDWGSEHQNGTSCCEWDGVTCDSAFMNVIELNLSSWHLMGNLGPNNTLFQLIHLRKLDLSSNNFNHSQIPSELGQFSSLTHLNLSSSNFRGPVPSEIAYLSKLQSLNLSSDDINIVSMQEDVWKKVVENLTDISELILSGVSFSSVPLPSVFMNLKSSLTTLDLRGCGLEGEGDHLRISHLPKLVKLDLSMNDLRLSVKNIFNNLISSSFSLEIVSLSGCSLQVDPTFLANFTQLTAIDLSDNNLSGSIPSWVANLTRLTAIDISVNNLSGSIPSWGANFTQLTAIDLSDNNLSGSIPSWLFSDLPNLEILSLTDNYLVGSIPSQVRQHIYHKLRVLNLAYNFLNGPIPAWCFSFPSIYSLDLSFNQFSHISDFSPAMSPSLVYLSLQSNNLQGSIPISIFNLVNITDLDLSSNNLSGFFDSNMFLKLKKLSRVDISNNNLLSFSERNIEKEGDFHDALSDLNYLNFSYCSITDFPVFLKQAPYLTSLDLSHNNIQGDVPKWFQDVAKDFLRYLSLSSNYLTRIELLQWSQLTIVDLSSNSLEGEIPIPPSSTNSFSVSKNKLTGGFSRAFCNLNYIQLLDLSHNNLTGILPQCLGNIIGSLIVLDLETNRFHGTMPETFLNATNLETLKLGGNKLKGLLPRSLDSCTQLEILDVGNNQIEDEFPNWLERLPNLQVLVLRDNKFHGYIAGPQTENPFPRLRILDLSKNYLKGPLPSAYITRLRDMMDIDVRETGQQYMLPQDFGDISYQDSIEVTMKGIKFDLHRILTIFTTFDFSNNQFDGEIPQVIGYLKSLKGLNLSHNILNGTIPPSFGNLSSLEWLDLSSNKLTGNIPSNMTILTSLEVFNVSYNQLTGSIPEGNQFNTFTNSSYIGNDGLCGKPLSRECGPDNEEPSPSFTSEDVSTHEDEFGWKPVVLGYVCGLVFGGSIGYFILSTGKPWWLVKMLLKSSKLKKLYILMQ